MEHAYRLREVLHGLLGSQSYYGRHQKPVPHAMLRFGNFDGDRQADRVNHGGAEKAVCVYPFDHYPYWSRQLGRDLRPGAFSENLTVSGAIETEVCVGDVFRIGEASATQQTLGSDLDALEAYIGSQQQVGVPADFGQRITKQG